MSVANYWIVAVFFQAVFFQAFLAHVGCSDGLSLIDTTKLLAPDGASSDLFGVAVAISGNLAIVGALGDDDKGRDSGSAYIFRSDDDGNSWTLQQKLTAPGGAVEDWFGASVAISGNLAIVGAFRDDDKGLDSGSAYIFRSDDDGESWAFQRKLTAPDGAINDWFGVSVAISGNLAIVGASQADAAFDSGSAYIFHSDDDGKPWTFQQKLTAFDGASDDWFGYSVAISGNLAIVGAYADDDKGRDSGSAYIFHSDDDGNSWTLQQKLTAFDGASDDWFGFAVAISGNLAIVGAHYDDDKGGDSGSAYIFRSDDDGNSWTFQQKLIASDGGGGQHFGYSAAISGNLTIVGAPRDDDKGSRSGSAYIFHSDDDGKSWTFQQKLTAFDGAYGDQFGWPVAISGDLAIVGARLDNDKGRSSGSAYIYHFEETETITTLPSTAPTSSPTTVPSTIPSDLPSDAPTVAPTITPTMAPSIAPTTPPSGAPSVVTLCADGIESHQGTVCCAASCGLCGGCGCANLPGGSNFCCPSTIAENGIPCELTSDTGCLLGDFEPISRTESCVGA
eukprot:scaffold1606_cov177-Pinguiococcus_pyrenoidosus.AAC.2